MGSTRLHNGLAAGWRWASHWSGAALRQARALARPRILMYHIIGEDDVSPTQFEWQLSFLRRHFEPVHLAILLDRIDARATTGREVVLTFDDGVRNHFATAWPLLQKHAVPATFFVCPGLIESEQWLWRTELRLRLKHMEAKTRSNVSRKADAPEDDVEAIMEWTKHLPMDERAAFQQLVTKHTRRFRPSREQMDNHAPLTWGALRSMDPALATIGSHTRTHPMLPTLDPSTLLAEIADSRKELERQLDRTVDLFSYPNGANNHDVVGAVRRHYRAAVTTRKGLVAEGDDPFLLPRIPAGHNRATFSRRMHKPTA